MAAHVAPETFEQELDANAARADVQPAEEETAKARVSG